MITIHFVGIGGAGMFALACIALEQGYKISGSDLVNSESLENLSKKGAKIYINHSENNITEDTNLLVYSGAIKKDNPEIIKAEKLKIKILSRSQFMGLITKNFKNLIAVSGSHGKTTTTSMITSILIDSNKDPTAIIGAHFNKIGGNSRLGSSDIAVCEACEYLNSFLDLDPKIGVILNIDFEHMDYFKNIENEKLRPHMIGIGPFIPHQDTPFHAEKPGTLQDTLHLLAILRLLFPKVLLPATTALGTIHPQGRELGILAGANVIMPNLSPVNVRGKYLLYDGKICTGDEAAECHSCMERRMEKIGYSISADRGDSKVD